MNIIFPTALNTYTSNKVQQNGVGSCAQIGFFLTSC